MISHVYKCPTCNYVRELHDCIDKTPSSEITTCDLHAPMTKMELISYKAPMHRIRHIIRQDLEKIKQRLDIVENKVQWMVWNNQQSQKVAHEPNAEV